MTEISTPQAKRKRVCLLVLGMHRSGTSALTRVLSLSGAALPMNLIGPGEGNERGHWEPQRLVNFCEEILAELGSSWHDWRPLELEKLSKSRIEQIQERFRTIVEEEFAGHDLFVVKDPRLCRLSQLFVAALEKGDIEVCPVLLVRNPLEVSASLRQRSRLWSPHYSQAHSSLLWLSYVLAAEAETRGLKRAVVTHESLMLDWRGTLASIALNTATEFPVSAEQAEDEVRSFLSDGLYRQRWTTGELKLDPVMRGWISQAFDALSKLASDPSRKASLRKLDKIRAEFEGSAPMICDLLENAITESVRAVENIEARMEIAGQRAVRRSKTAETVNRKLKSLMSDREETVSTLRSKLKLMEQEKAAFAHKFAELERELSTAQSDFEAERRRRGEALRATQSYIDAVREEFRSSRSWRITAPLRAGGRMYRYLLRMLGLFSFVRSEQGYLTSLYKSARILLTEGPRGFAARLDAQPKKPPARQPVPPTVASTDADVDPISCLLVTTRHVEGIAQTMARILRQEGFNTRVQFDAEDAHRHGHVIVLCPQMFEQLPPRYIAVQMEQSINPRWFTEQYFEKLNNSQAIIDYSIRNISFLRENGIPLEKLHYVPLDTDKALAATVANNNTFERRGILFYGDDKCERRRKILDAVARQLPQLKIVNNLFGEALHKELMQAAVILNIHYYPDALLETARIHEALSFGAPVVSERGSDQEEHDTLENIVTFVDAGDVDGLIKALRPFVESSHHAESRAAATAEFATRETNRFETYFRRFLLSQRMIGLDGFVERASNYPVPVPADPRLCLSLPETPDRRRLFIDQGHDEFQVWDGLKMSPGWMGAALSYKHLFTRLNSEKAGRAVVCEDDVLFPPDFERRFKTVLRYLEKTPFEIFSGFIADANENLVITKVEEFEGELFIHIDRTVSMVFNIYSDTIIEYLSGWDIADLDVETNTIDRYLERRTGTKAILTLPYLVQHRPDAASTIWGFDNTAYDELTTQSEILLARKVDEFRRKHEKGN